MVGIKLETFSGMMPTRDVRLLPEENASYSVNQRIESGALDAIRGPRLIGNLLASTQKVYRIPLGAADNIDNSFFVQFADAFTDVVRTPVVNDQYQRHYWASPSTGFLFATKAELMGGGQGRTLVVPQPLPGLLVDAVPGTGNIVDGKNTAPIITRSYLVTFVGEYGEEGPPSIPVEATGAVDQDWRLRDIPQPVPSQSNINIVTIRIYRTETANSGATVFNRVVDIGIGQTVYIDRASSLSVGGNPELDEIVPDRPPLGMQGLALMPNGVMVGFKDNNLYFSDNYKPHSWPAGYTLTVQHNIVGLAVFGTTCVVVTEGNPVAVSGTSGAIMSMAMSDDPMPCVSRQSIVVSSEGVHWATSLGIAQWNPSGVRIVSSEIIDRSDWVEHYNPLSIRATMVDDAFTAIYVDAGQNRAFAIQKGSLTHYDGFGVAASINNIFRDVWSGRSLLIQGGQLFEFMHTAIAKRKVTWKSKEFQTPKPVSITFAIAYFEGAASATIRLYAKGVLKATRVVGNGQIFRWPGGFKSDLWQIEIEVTGRFRRFLMAQSIQELKAL